jgi:hypothetical protein
LALGGFTPHASRNLTSPLPSWSWRVGSFEDAIYPNYAKFAGFDAFAAYALAHIRERPGSSGARFVYQPGD